MNKTSLTLTENQFQNASTELKQAMESLSIDALFHSKVLIIADEHITNLIKNNEDRDDLFVNIILDNTKVLTVIFEDNGCAFNPLKDWDIPEIDNSENKKLGGLGIFLMQQLSSSMSYRYNENLNVTKFEFN